MLRKMMQQYWVLLLLLLLPATLLLIKKRDSRLEPIAITNNDDAEERVEQPIYDTGITVNHTPATKPKHTSAFEDTIPLHLVDIKDAHALADTMPQIMVDSIPKDPVTPSPYVKELTPNDYIAELAETPIKKQTKHKWQITLAYAATPLPSLNKTDNFMTIPEISVASAPAAKLYNWGDYINYVDNNAESMDSTSASNMRHIAIINSNNPADSLSESKHHAYYFIQISGQYIRILPCREYSLAEFRECIPVHPFHRADINSEYELIKTVQHNNCRADSKCFQNTP